MKFSVIQTLLDGGDGLSDNIKDSRQYINSQHKIEEIITKYTTDLTEKERHGILYEIGLLHSQMEIEKSDLYFKEGVKILLKLLIELFYDG